MSEFKINFDNADWFRIQNNWEAWWGGHLDRPLVMIEGFDHSLSEEGVSIHNFGELVINLAKNFNVEQILDYLSREYPPSIIMEMLFQNGNSHSALELQQAFLGARVFSTQETVWFEPEDDQPINQIKLEYQEDNKWWVLIQELTRRAEERWGSILTVAHTDLGGNFDILASLRTTQRLLFDLYDSPEDVARLINDITRLWLKYYVSLNEIIKPGGRGTTPWAPIWSPGKCYMLQSDFSYMLSPRMFERYILPDLDDCCRYLDHAFYHMDGKGQIPHLDLLLSLDHLKGIQWIPGDGAPPPEEWLPLLKRIRDGGKLIQLFVKPEGAIKIVRELGGKGFAFYINQQMNKKEAAEFFTYITAL